MTAKGDGRRAISSALLAALVVCAAAPAHADPPPSEGLADVVLPGGLPGALAAIGDRLPPDRAVFVAELVERFYNTPKPPRRNQFPQLQALFARLDSSAGRPPTEASPPDLLPLPLGARWWSDVVFRRPVADDALLTEILQDREAAYLYWALLALDAPTREWIAGEPALVARVVRGRAARFVIAAPAVRVRDGRVQVPGGDRAIPAWEALVGARVTDPEAFVGMLLDADEGWHAHVLRSLAMLTDEQLATVLRLDAGVDRRVDALERLDRVFVRTGQGTDLDGRPFSRPWRDPALLLADLHTDGAALRLAGGEPFWTRVFDAHGDPARLVPADATTSAGPVDPAWLVEHVFDTDVVQSRLRAEQVILASRTFDEIAPGAENDAAVAIAALGHYPAVVRALERMRVRDPTVYRAAVDRAEALQRIRDTAVKTRAAAQFQGTFALVARGVARGSVPEARVAALVTSLAAVPTSDAGEYEGRVAGWIDSHLRPLVVGPDDPGPALSTSTARGGDQASSVDQDLLRLLAGPTRVAAPGVEWEGMVYRVDLGAAEAARLERARGEAPPPWLPSAWRLLGMADRIEHEKTSPAALSRDAAAVTRLADDLGLDVAAGATTLETDVVHAFTDAGAGGAAGGARLAASLRRLADDLTARGLVELAYAAALGGTDAGPIGAGDAASRHDFGFGREDGGAGPVAWRLPVPSVRARGPWHVEGALLALDVCLADRWMTRVSGTPLPTAPSIDKVDRRSLIEVITLLESALLSDAARDAIADAIRGGRTRLAAATATGIGAIRDVVPLGAVRASLLPWVFDRDRDRLVEFLSTTELLWLGLGAAPPEPSFDAWGAPVRPRLGCLCLEFPRRRAPDALAGRLSSGILMGALPDVNLRLAELLADLRMPAVLLPSVAAAATPDVVDRAAIRYPDDLRALREQARRLSVDDVEQYLSLLTTGGPLVPAGAAVASHASSAP